VLLQAEAAERARAELRGLKDQLAAAAAQQEAAAAAMQGAWLLLCLGKVMSSLLSRWNVAERRLDACGDAMAVAAARCRRLQATHGWGACMQRPQWCLPNDACQMPYRRCLHGFTCKTL
jgi:hypothetical protein